MKRLTLLLVFLTTVLLSFAEDRVRIGGIEYEIDLASKTAKVYRRTAVLPDTVVIPATIDYNGLTLPVSSIRDFAFSSCRGLTSITIPNSVTSIGDHAFVRCSSLTSITIPNSVTSIGEYAFSDCSSLTSITIPNSVTSIGEYAFSHCKGLTSVSIPNSVTSIGNGAFFVCEGLTSVSIPNSVTSIGNEVFFGCEGLTSVSIPNSVTKIGDHAFSYCRGLTSVTIPNSVTCIGDSAFFGCSKVKELIYADGCKTALRTWLEDITSVTIPNSVTSIGEYAFSSCSGLTSVSIPNSVKSIGDNAFFLCSSLTSITIPNSVTSIGDWAFSSCSGLTNITILNPDVTIGTLAFMSCMNLTSVNWAKMDKMDKYALDLVFTGSSFKLPSFSARMNSIFEVTDEKQDAAFAAPTSSMLGTWYYIDYLMSKGGWGYKDEYIEFKAGNKVVVWTQSPYDHSVWVGHTGTMSRVHQDVTITFTPGVKSLVRGKSTAGMSEREKYNYNQSLQKYQTIQSRDVWKCKLEILDKDYMLLKVITAGGMYSDTDYQLVKEEKFKQLNLK